MTVKRNARGEVIDAVTVSQFWPGKTEFACGFYSAATIAYAGEPGKGPSGSSSDVEKWADEQYLKQYGADGPAQMGGVSIDDEHRLIVSALPSSGMSHYQDLSISNTTSQQNDLDQVEGALLNGYPIIATVSEGSIFDVELKKNPYWWGPSGSHVIVITGISPTGHLLCHDSANVSGSLQGPNTPLPGPRAYDAARIDMSWATMCRMPWLVPFPNGWNPATGQRINQVVDTFNQMVVQYWTVFQHTTGALPRDTGIFKAWREEFLAGKFRGEPLSPEIAGVDAHGNAIVYQVFNGSTAIWASGKAVWM